MGKLELDGVRQALETALDSLRDDTSSVESISPVRDRPGSSEGSSREAPVIIIVAGRQQPAVLDQSYESATVSAGPNASNERKLSHPGLERFIIEADTRPAVPKTCFMEPDRSCVNSGACEMRGF